MHKAERLTDLAVTQRAQPSSLILGLPIEPGANGLNENDIRQARHHDLRSRPRVAGLMAELPESALEPASRMVAGVSNMNEPRQKRNEWIIDSIFELEHTTNKMRLRAAAPVSDEAAFVAKVQKLFETQRLRFCIAADDVPSSVRYDHQISARHRTPFFFAIQFQPASTPFDDVKVCKLARRQLERPRRRKFRIAEYKTSQMERTQNVRERVRRPGLVFVIHRNSVEGTLE